MELPFHNQRHALKQGTIMFQPSQQAQSLIIDSLKPVAMKDELQRVARKLLADCILERHDMHCVQRAFENKVQEVRCRAMCLDVKHGMRKVNPHAITKLRYSKRNRGFF